MYFENGETQIYFGCISSRSRTQRLLPLYDILYSDHASSPFFTDILLKSSGFYKRKSTPNMPVLPACGFFVICTIKNCKKTVDKLTVSYIIIAVEKQTSPTGTFVFLMPSTKLCRLRCMRSCKTANDIKIRRK